MKKKKAIRYNILLTEQCLQTNVRKVAVSRILELFFLLFFFSLTVSVTEVWVLL